MKGFKDLFFRLRDDVRGVSLIFMAIGMIPIMAAIGSGIDMARAYMIQAKLQEAVDSAALAGRRSMTGEDVSTAKTSVDVFLAFNFHDQMFGTTPLVTKLSKPDVGTVEVEASTTMPTTIMSLFGIMSIPIKVRGQATQNFTNVDIMLVLDTTGSMDDSISTGSGGTIKKLEALKSAVQALYAQLGDAQKQLNSQNLRMRFGIVPYAAAVNVGALIKGVNPNYLWTQNVPYYQWHATTTTVKTWYGTTTQTTWAYGRQTYNLANYVNGGALGDVDGNGDYKTATWNGCIEERRTDSGITANDSRTAAPEAAYDLDIDRIPDVGVTDTQWKPYIYDVSAASSANGGGPNTYCPAAASGLATMNQSQLTAALGQLQSRGSTYHDIGMIWGVRMMSSLGMFRDSNPDVWNGQKVARYIIFMSDGQMSAPMDYCSTRACNTARVDHSIYYSSYGIEGSDRRVGGTSDDDNADRHTKRFLMACNAAKAKSISIWTVAFGTGNVDSMNDCATNADQSATVSDSNALIAKFAEIGRNIGPLRISK